MSPDSNTAFTTDLPARLGLCALAALLGGGCMVSRPRVAVEETISDSLGLPGAVVFRTAGGPLGSSPEAGDALPLREALRRAVETSPELQAALARVRAAEAEADLAGLLPNPILSIVFRIPEGGGKPEIEAGLAADLLALLQRPRRSSAAAHRLEAAAASALSSALDLAAEVQELYASVQALEELVPVFEARLAVLDRLREVAQARLELGEGTRHDVTAIDSERLELAVETAQTRQELRLERLALTRRIGDPTGAARWQLDRWQAPDTVPTDEAAWIGAALLARPEVLAIQWELLARRDEVGLAGWNALDGLSVGLDAERKDDWSLGPSASTPLPVFDTGSARERRAMALAAEARHQLVAAQRAVVEDVRVALAVLTGSQANLERVLSELIPLQERRRGEIDAAYRLGHVDITALLFAEHALQQTQARRVDLERGVSAALVRLERAVGGPSAFRSAVAELGAGARP